MKQYGRPRFMGPKGQMNLCCGGCNSHDENGHEKNWRKRARRENKQETENHGNQFGYEIDYYEYEE